MARALNPLFVTVTWGAGGSTAEKSLNLAELCISAGLTTCLHLTCTNMSRALIDEALDRAKSIGVRNILALRGDPPREDEYSVLRPDGETAFTWAIDLVTYIRKRHGDYFCVGVAAYPDGHAQPDGTQSVDFDLPYLRQKTAAGADFIMTQLFFDVPSFVAFEKRLREDESGIFRTIPIIPGLMPIQSYNVIRRITQLSHTKVPPQVWDLLDAVRNDDSAVKAAGVDILCDMVDSLKRTNPALHRGFHFYTLNLEKAVSHIIERSGLLTRPDPEPPVSQIAHAAANRAVVQHVSAPKNARFEVSERDAGRPDFVSFQSALVTSEGEGSLGREATWDDYPNGRWGDARSPGTYKPVRAARYQS